MEPIFDAIWPPGVRATLPWHQLQFENAPRRVVVSDSGADTCHVGLYVRECFVDGKLLRIGGIGGVLTYAHARRKGYAAAAIGHGLALFVEEDCAFALLCCNDYNYAFYRGLGWRQSGARILIEQPAGKKEMTEMEPFLFDLKLSVNPKEIDLCGLPW